MIQIPEQLQQEGIRFVLVEERGKIPIQSNWTNSEISYNTPQLLEHLSNKGNYGVVGGGEKKLVVIDFDNKEVQDKVIPLLPKTFTVQAGGGLLHKYFFTDIPESFKILTEGKDTLVDVQGVGKQVIGPGSIHPNGNVYKVVDDSNISYLPIAVIKVILEPFQKKKKKVVEQFSEKKEYPRDKFLEKLQSKLPMERVLKELGVDTSRNPTACPFHSSKGGRCLGFDDIRANCFHCGGSWNIFSFVKEHKKCSFKGALNYLSDLAGLTDELVQSRREYIENMTVVGKVEEISESMLALRGFVSELLQSKNFGGASEVIAEDVEKKFKIFTTRDDKSSEVWVYREGIYVPQGRSLIKEYMRQLMGVEYSIWLFNQVIAKIEADTQIDPQEFFETNYVDELPVQNGILNINTRELKPFTPSKIFFNKINASYDPKATCPQIEEYLNSTLLTKEDIDVFYEIGGFTLLKEYKYEKAFMFVGAGRNGKDKSLELIKRLLGLENVCSVPLSSIKPESFIVSEFFGKMANIAGEISSQDLRESSEFKALTGRSLRSAPRKFLKPISFVNYAKFIFACNELPMVYDPSRGFWDRWVLLEFPYTFVTEQEYNDTEDKTNLRIRDEEIINKISTESEFSGLLNKFLEGLERLNKKREFSSAKGSDEVKKTWIIRSNSVMAFCLQCVEEECDGFITKKDFRREYSKFCRESNAITKSDFVIKRTMEELFGANEANKNPSGHGFEKVWEGVKWKKIPPKKRLYTQV